MLVMDPGAEDPFIATPTEGLSIDYPVDTVSGPTLVAVFAADSADAEPPREHDLAVLHDRDRDTRHLERLERALHPCIQVGYAGRKVGRSFLGQGSARWQDEDAEQREEDESTSNGHDHDSCSGGADLSVNE